MAYNKDFKNISVVCENFDLKYLSQNFIKSKKFEINSYLKERLEEFFDDNSTFFSEVSICERIIFPIIYEVARKYDLPVWSQSPLNVNKQKKLTGITDFLIAPAIEGRLLFRNPIVCLGEAKKNDFEKGWGQVSAEMYAAQLSNIDKTKKQREKQQLDFNNKLLKKIESIPVFGLVTDGKDWEFGKLEKDKFTINKESFKTPSELNKTFNSLNWLFSEARKNVDLLLSMDK